MRQSNPANLAEHFVRIEIRADILLKLIVDQKLAASQLHGLSLESKSSVHNAVLESLKLRV